MPAGDQPTVSLASTTVRADETLPLDRLQWIDAECERFRSAWSAGGMPRIEDHLRDVEQGERRLLLRELLSIEIEGRRRRGDSVDVEAYRSRFRDPDAARALEWALRDAEGPEGARSVGDYELMGPLGQGGMGLVYRARQRSANRVVALKLMREGAGSSRQAARRFRFEAEASANLDHPNIVPIYEVGREAGQPFFTMKLVEGGTLAEHLARYVGRPLDAARLMSKVARAVQYAHDRGFLHRDLKPANILLDPGGEPYVTDFGLAKRIGSERTAEPPDEHEPSLATDPGAMVGTPSYMPPEQAAAQVRPTAVSDVYSLGATLYAALTGRPPFQASTVMETVLLVTEKEPEPPRRLRPDLPADLERICLKCLEKAPSKRYASAGALADDLDRFLRGEYVEARRVGPWGRFRRWMRRESEIAYLLIGLSAVTVLTVFNHSLLDPDVRDGSVFRRTVGVEMAWIGAAVTLHALGKRPGRRDAARAARIVVEMGLLSLMVYTLGDVESGVVAGYPVLIAAVGLTTRVRMVWLGVASAVVGYVAIWLAEYARGEVAKPHHLDAVIALFVITGAVTAHQVRRTLALSRFYEHQAPRG